MPSEKLTSCQTPKNERLLIVDGYNFFIRSYIVDPSLSTNGSPIGGLKGVIKSLQKVCREIRPDKIIVCWDGQGGSKKRRLMNKQYKEGRKPIRLNRGNSTLSESDERYNKIWQQQRLIEYYNSMPVIQFMFDSIEADDIIAYVTKLEQFEDWQKVIVSSDKDFYQLLDDKTVIYRPVQKKFVNKVRLMEDFNIHPNNFSIARAMCGDSSDNLKGVKGAGMKTVAKRFPFLKEEESFMIDSVISYAKSQIESKIKLYKSVVEGEDLILANYQIMQLYVPTLTMDAKRQIRYICNQANPGFNQTMIKTMMLKDGFGEINFEELFALLRKISFDH